MWTWLSRPDDFYESMQFKLFRPSSTQHTACKVLQHDLPLLNLALALPQNLHPKLQILQATLWCEYRNPSLGTPRVDDATKCHQRENMPDLKGLSSLPGIRLQGLEKIWYMAKGHIPKYTVGPYRICSDGNPMTHLMLLWSYLILPNYSYI